MPVVPGSSLSRPSSPRLQGHATNQRQTSKEVLYFSPRSKFATPSPPPMAAKGTLWSSSATAVPTPSHEPAATNIPSRPTSAAIRRQQDSPSESAYPDNYTAQGIPQRSPSVVGLRPPTRPTSAATSRGRQEMALGSRTGLTTSQPSWIMPQLAHDEGMVGDELPIRAHFAQPKTSRPTSASVRAASSASIIPSNFKVKRPDSSMAADSPPTPLDDSKYATIFAAIRDSFDASILHSGSLVVAIEEALGKLRAEAPSDAQEPTKLGGSVAALLLLRLSHLMQNGCGEIMRKLLFMVLGCTYDPASATTHMASTVPSFTSQHQHLFENQWVGKANADCTFLVRTPMFMSECLHQQRMAAKATEARLAMSSAVKKAGAAVSRMTDRSDVTLKRLCFKAWRQHVRTHRSHEEAWLKVQQRSRTQKLKFEYFLKWRVITSSECESRIGVTAEHSTMLLSDRLEKVAKQCARKEEHVVKLTETKGRLNEKVERLVALLEEERVETDKARSRLTAAELELKAFKAKGRDAMAMLYRQASRPLGSSIQVLNSVARQPPGGITSLTLPSELGAGYTFPIASNPAAQPPAATSESLLTVGITQHAAKWLTTFPPTKSVTNPLKGCGHHEGSIQHVVGFMLWWVNQSLAEARMHLSALEETAVPAALAIRRSRVAISGDDTDLSARHLLAAGDGDTSTWAEVDGDDDDLTDEDWSDGLGSSWEGTETEEPDVQPSDASKDHKPLSRAASSKTTSSKRLATSRAPSNYKSAALANVAIRRWRSEIEDCPQAVSSLAELAGGKVYQILLWRLVGHLLDIEDYYIPRTTSGKRSQRRPRRARSPNPPAEPRDDGADIITTPTKVRNVKPVLFLSEAEGVRCRRVLRIAGLFGLDGGIEEQQLASSAKEVEHIHFQFLVRLLQRFTSAVPLGRSPFTLASNSVEGLKVLMANAKPFEESQQAPTLSRGTVSVGMNTASPHSTLATALGLSTPFLEFSSALKPPASKKAAALQGLVPTPNTQDLTSATSREVQLDQDVSSSAAFANAIASTKGRIELNEKWASLSLATGNYAAALASAMDRTDPLKVAVAEALEDPISIVAGVNDIRLSRDTTDRDLAAAHFYLQPQPIVGSKAWRRLAINSEFILELFSGNPIPKLSTVLCFASNERPTSGGAYSTDRESSASYLAKHINDTLKGARGALQEASLFYACSCSTEATQTPIATIDSAAFERLCADIQFAYVISGSGNTDPYAQLQPSSELDTNASLQLQQQPTLPKIKSKDTTDAFKDEIKSAGPRLFKLLCHQYGEEGKGISNYFPAAVLPIAMVHLFVMWLQCLHAVKGRHLHAPPLPFTTIERAAEWFQYFFVNCVTRALPHIQSKHLVAVSQLPRVQSVFRANKDNLRKVFLECCNGTNRMSLESFIACFIKQLRKLDPARGQFLFHACRLGNGTVVPTGPGLGFDGYLCALTAIALSVKGNVLDDYANSVEHFLHVGLFPHYRAKLNLASW